MELYVKTVLLSLLNNNDYTNKNMNNNYNNKLRSVGLIGVMKDTS